MATTKKVEHIILPPEDAKKYKFNDLSVDYIEIKYDEEKTKDAER